MIGEAFDGHRPREILGQQAERMGMLEMAQRVHLQLGVAVLVGEQSRQFAAPRIPVRFGQQHPRVEQLVQQDRMAIEVSRRPGRGAHQLRQPRQHRGVLDQERQVRAAAGDGLEQRQQAQEHRPRPRRDVDVVGDLRPGGGRGGEPEQLRHQRVEALLGQRGQSR